MVRLMHFLGEVPRNTNEKGKVHGKCEPRAKERIEETSALINSFLSLEVGQNRGEGLVDGRC